MHYPNLLKKEHGNTRALSLGDFTAKLGELLAS